MKKLIIILAMFLTIQGIGQDYIQNQSKVPDLSFTISGNVTKSVSLDTLYDANGLSTYYGKTVMYLPNDKVTGVYSSGIYDKSYLELRREYQAYCDSIVIDTITETGNVVFNVIVKNGKPELVASDTTWYEQQCSEYKISNSILYSGLSLSDLLLTSSTGTLSYSKPSKSTFETSITREKYCKCKYKQGSNDDFFEWVDKNYLK